MGAGWLVLAGSFRGRLLLCRPADFSVLRGKKQIEGTCGDTFGGASCAVRSARRRSRDEEQGYPKPPPGKIILFYTHTSM